MAKKTSPPIPNMTNPGRSAELLRALNAAAASLQRAAHSEAEVFRVFREQVVALGLRGGISLLDPTRKRLTLRVVAYPDQILSLLAELEKHTGLKLDGLEFAVADVDAYQQAVETGQAVFVPNSNAVAAQRLPQAVQPFAGRIQQAFGAPPAVFAPLISEGRVEGILHVVGAGLTRDDVSAVQAFANHLAVRLDNARAVSALQQSEARYRVLFEQSPDGILLIDAETGKTLEANETAPKQLGYTREEFSALRIFDYEALEKPEETAKHMQKVRREGSDDFETLHRTKSGEIRNVHVWVKTLLSGERVLFYAIFQDITERKQAEEETRLLLALTQAINEAPSFDSALRMALQKVCESTDWDMGETWIPRADGSALELSPVWYGRRPGLETFSADGQSFVFPPGKGLPGRVWVSRQPEWLKDVSVDGEIFPRAALALKASIKSALAVPTLAGDQMLVLVFFMQEAREGDERLVKIVSAAAAQLGSLFQRKRAEERLRQSESSLRESQIIAGLGSYVLDFSTGLWKSSGILDKIFGIDETYVRSVEGWADLVHPDERQQMLGYFTNEVIGKRVRFDKEYKIIRKNDQAERWVHGVGELEVDAQNRLLKMHGTITDITERKQRERELQAVVTVSAALRTAQTQAEMMPIIVDQLLDLLKADGAALVRHDDTTGESVVELVRGALPATSGLRLPAGAGISGYVISHGQPYLTNDLQSDPRFAGPDVNFGQVAVACWPLIGQGQIVGALWVSRAQPFTENEQRLLSAISDITANALRRASLHEQTEQRLQHLTALRAVDMAISSSFDLRMTLGVLLGQTLAQLRVDAADILLLNPAMQTLDYSAGRGFRGSGITRSHLRLGECQAGRAALERRTAYVPNLAEETAFVRAGLLAGEDFVAYHVTPLIAKGQVKGVLEVFQRAPLAPDPEWLDFLETLAGQAAIAIDNSELFEGLQRSNTELTLAYDATIEGWSRALDLRDKETEGHTQRVTEMTLRLAHAMGLSAAELVHVRRGALLHDMGKLGVPDSILLKPGPLTDEEWVVMRKHPVYVYDLLSPIVFLRPALDIPHYHHEKWDGTGYPRGLKGELIPLTARIFAVVDVWDALRSDRPYRPAWPEEKVRDHLREQAGKHFDPAVVEAFLKTLMEA